jgi:hypothetical protein
MKCLRIYATPDGESHFGETDIPTTTTPLFANEASFQLSGHYSASRIVSCTFRPAFVKRFGILHRGEC